MKAKTVMIRSGVLAVSMGAALIANAAEVRWLQADTKDMVSNALVRSAAEAPMSANANRNQELVEFQWALDAVAAIESQDRGSFNDSRQYWVDTTAAELSRGLTVFTTTQNALIRVNPLKADDSTVLDRNAIRLTQQGRNLDTNASITTFATDDQLRSTGAPFAEGTIAFRLNKNVAAGPLTLAIDNRAAADTAYVVHVFEAGSPVVAEVRTASSTHVVGSNIDATLNLIRANGTAQGFLVSPDGKTSLPVNFSQQGNEFHADIAAPQAQGVGLWELHTHFEGTSDQGLPVLRDVKTAINITAPTARLAQSAQLISDGSGKDGLLSVQLGVEVAAAGRYQLSGVLYGTAKDGSQRPLTLAHSAQWLEAGSQNLPLTFDVAAAGISAPYEIHDLRLLDQSRLGALHRQARALRIQ